MVIEFEVMGLWLGYGQSNQKILTIQMMTKIKSLFFNGLDFVSILFSVCN
jgi:hypothetical protein